MDKRYPDRRRLLHTCLLFSICVLVLPVKVWTQSKEDACEGEEEQETAACGGTERWLVKTLDDSNAYRVHFNPLTTNLAFLVALPTPFPNPNMQRVQGIEDKTYSVTCLITAKKVETDSDYHLILSDGRNTLIAEIPDPSCPDAAHSGHATQYSMARSFIDIHLPAGDLNAIAFGPVTLTGVAFIDPPHNQTGASPNNLELHPVLDIHYPVDAVREYEDPSFSIRIVPNPLTDLSRVIIITAKVIPEDLWLDLYTVYGKRVKEIPFSPVSGNAATLSIDKEDLARGIYFCRFRQSRTFIGYKKLVVE
jgi:hypothetical protein